MSLLSWLSKSSSVSNSSSSSLSMTDSSSSSLLPSSLSMRHPHHRRYCRPLQGKILCQNTIHKYSMLLTNVVPSIFYIIHLGIKTWLSEDNASWFDSHTWLHYNESKDLAFCYMYIHIAITKNDIQYKYYN